MLKIESEMFHNLCDEAIRDKKKDTFVDAFTEFIVELDDVDLSQKTKQHLYDIFIKDMNIYFENKKYEKTLRNSVHKDKIRDKIEELKKEKLKFDNDIRIYTMRESFDFQETILKELLEE